MPTQTPQRRAIAMREILLLIATGVLILLIIIPTILRTRATAASKQCCLNLRMLGLAAHQYHDLRGTLPPSRIAPGYATWAVLVAPFLPDGEEAFKWDLTKPYGEQPQCQLTTATIKAFFCPVRRFRPGLSQPGIDVLPDGRDVPGRAGDYAGVAGSPRAIQLKHHEDEGDGCIILARANFDQGKLTDWRGRIDLSAVRQGTSNALLLGERHVPAGSLNADRGDGCIYNGYLPRTAVRIIGPSLSDTGQDFGLASSPQDRAGGPDRWQRIFGSAHAEGIVPFCMADGSIRKFRPTVSATLLRELAILQPVPAASK